MTVNEVFSKISARMIEGMMLNDKMANYYDFLGMMGFKRMHEYHFLLNSAEMRGVNRYFINHYNELLKESPVGEPFTIQSSWYTTTRQGVGPNTKRSAVKSGLEAWTEWLHETKKMYEKCYCELCDIDEIAASCKVKELISRIDMDVKCADRLHIKVHSTDYDLPTIFLVQDDLHEKYDKMSQEIGVCIC